MFGDYNFRITATSPWGQWVKIMACVHRISNTVCTYDIFLNKSEEVSESDIIYHRADSRFAPSQWETTLLCKVSHWLGASLESILYQLAVYMTISLRIITFGLNTTSTWKTPFLHKMKWNNRKHHSLNQLRMKHASQKCYQWCIFPPIKYQCVNNWYDILFNVCIIIWTKCLCNT